MTLLVGTDFSGLGSPEQALKRLGVNHKVLFACDKDKYAKQSYLANNETEIFYDDITTRDQSQTPYVDLYFFIKKDISQKGLIILIEIHQIVKLIILENALKRKIHGTCQNVKIRLQFIKECVLISKRKGL